METSSISSGFVYSKLKELQHLSLEKILEVVKDKETALEIHSLRYQIPDRRELQKLPKNELTQIYHHASRIIDPINNGNSSNKGNYDLTIQKSLLQLKMYLNRKNVTSEITNLGLKYSQIEKDVQLENISKQHLELMEELKETKKTLATLSENAKNELESISEFKKRLNDSQNELISEMLRRNREFTKSTDQEFQKTLDDYRRFSAQQKTEELDLLKKNSNRANEYLQNIENYHEKISDLHVKVTGVAAHTTGSALAENHKSAAFRDYVTSIVLFTIGLVIVLISGYSIFKSLSTINPDSSVSWQWVFTKSSFALIAAAAATVSFKFSSDFMNSSKENKQFELELLALEPFLSNLNDQEISDQVKAEYVHRAFGHRLKENSDNLKSTESKNDADANKIIELLFSIKELVSKN